MSRISISKISPLLLSFLFVISCRKVEIPSSILELIYTPTIMKAMEEVKKVRASNTNVLRDSNNQIIGKESYTMVVDRSSFEEGYHFEREDEYSGSQVAYDSKYGTSLYLTKKETTLTYNSDESLYEVSITFTGYPNQNKEGNLKEQTSLFRYTASKFKEEIDTPIFYAQETSGRYTGGYYLADFFKSILSESDSFERIEDTLVYHIEDKVYPYGKEKAIVSETLKMNRIGMLTEMRQHAKNTTTGVVSDSETIVTYNN